MRAHHYIVIPDELRSLHAGRRRRIEFFHNIGQKQDVLRRQRNLL